MRPVKDKPPPDSFQAKRWPALRSGLKRKVSFQLTPHGHDLLRAEAARRNMRQVMLLELMIRHYCDPEKIKNEPDRSF